MLCGVSMTLALPMSFEPAFLDDLPYDPSVLLFDQLTAIDVEASRVVCRFPTARALHFTDQQRAHPVRHPRHVAGAVLVHSTGMLGFIHAYYVLGLRHHEGWVGYGTNMHDVSFRKLVPPGTPIFATCTATKVRRGAERIVARYRFEYEHEGERCYQGEQSAFWVKTKS